MPNKAHTRVQVCKHNLSCISYSNTYTYTHIHIYTHLFREHLVPEAAPRRGQLLATVERLRVLGHRLYRGMYMCMSINRRMHTIICAICGIYTGTLVCTCILHDPPVSSYKAYRIAPSIPNYTHIYKDKYKHNTYTMHITYLNIMHI